MIAPYLPPPIEPPPIHPSASPSERLRYQREMQIYRSELRERDDHMKWDMAAHLVGAAVLGLFVLWFGVLTIHALYGPRGLSIAFGGVMVLILAVVEVKRRL